MSEKDENVHSGHRARMRERFFLHQDFEGFDEHEILEFVIGYLQPRKNMNVVAHRLIDRFGSLSRVFDAPADELMKVEGVGPLMAAFIKSQCALLRAYMQDKYSIISPGNFNEDMANYISSLFLGYTTERVYMICLDNSNRIIKQRMLCEGSCNRVGIDVSAVVREAVLVNAASVMLAHNHPSGVMMASNEDIEVTRIIEDALSVVNIRLADHIIVVGDRHISIGEDEHFKVKRFMKYSKK